MKLLNGSELASYISERQAKEVRRLQAIGVQPTLRILMNVNDPVIQTYVRLKQRYGSEIGVEVQIDARDDDLTAAVAEVNTDSGVHGTIIQLPVQGVDDLDALLNSVASHKDVDGLGAHADFDSATATAILWLLAGYNVELAGKRIVVVGQGKLVGGPLSDILLASGHDVVRANSDTEDLARVVRGAEILISGTGVPGLIQADWIRDGAVVVDAGTASDSGKIVGDLDQEVYARDNLTITPQKGGVGPLTVCSLFDNVLRSARSSAVQ